MSCQKHYFIKKAAISRSIQCAYWFTVEGGLVWSALKCLTTSGHVGLPAQNRMAFCTTTVRLSVLVPFNRPQWKPPLTAQKC